MFMTVKKKKKNRMKGSLFEGNGVVLERNTATPIFKGKNKRKEKKKEGKRKKRVVLIPRYRRNGPVA